MHWVEMLPDTQTPSWLGLPSNAEKVLLTTQGTLQPVISVICTVVFCHSHWKTTRPDSSSSVHLFRFHVFTGLIINHLSLCSSVFTFILTGRLSATVFCPKFLLWTEYCVCVWCQRICAVSANLSSSPHLLVFYGSTSSSYFAVLCMAVLQFSCVVVAKVLCPKDGCVSPHPPAAVFHSHHVALLKYYPHPNLRLGFKTATPPLNHILPPRFIRLISTPPRHSHNPGCRSICPFDHLPYSPSPSSSLPPFSFSLRPVSLHWLCLFLLQIQLVKNAVNLSTLELC